MSSPGSSTASGLAAAAELVRARGVPAQLCVIEDDRIVLDLAVNCRPDDLFWLFSASKPFVALLVHRLAAHGAVSLDRPVAAYWPEFGQHGKAEITVRHVLQHRSGLPVIHGALGDALTMSSWRRSVRAIERARPRHPAGGGPAYHFVSYGFILGELVQRVTGRPLPAVLDQAFLTPLGLADTHLGLPSRLWARHVGVRGDGAPGRLTQAVANRRITRQAVIPAAGISATARDVARFYQALLHDGELDGARVLRPGTLAEATRPSSEGELDQFLKLRIRWSHGFQLGGPVPGRATSHPMGDRSSRLTFGHNGSNACVAWADPTRRLAVAYLTGRLPAGLDRARHPSQVSDAILAAS
ncbi:MAG: beta-lactamase family protein [Actinobacteria bacterium]|nr:beta-lactamase family protein [Actinomycetota bacterium]